MAPTTSGPTFAITPRDIRVPAAQMPNVTSQGAVDIAGLPATVYGGTAGDLRFERLT